MGIAEDYAKFKEEHQQGRVYDVKSVLSIGDAMLYQEEQTASDKALEVGENVLKSLYNGTVVQYGGGAANFLRGLHDVNVEQLNRDYPERMQGDSTLLEDIANSSVFQPYEIKADTAAGEYAYNLVQGAGQLAVQIPASMALGPVGAGALMGMTIAGQDYKELREQDVDPETALKAGAIDAAIQAPLESIGLGAITKSFPANTLFKQQLRFWAQKAATEGLTEFAQQFPEDISKIWALNKDKSWDEIVQLVADDLPNIFSRGVYSGSIGAVLAGGAGSIQLAFDRTMRNAMKREAYNVRMEQEESRINRIKESGENPARAAVIINDNLQNQTVYVDGEALAGYAQEKGAEKVAESLGVSVEDIEKAAADGSTVDVKLGNFEATCAAFDGFFQEVKDGTAFEDGGYTPKKEQAEQEQIKRDRERYAELRDQFKAEEDRIISEFAEAGVGKQLARGQVELLRRFAENINPDYALAIMQSYKVRRGENGEVQAGYGQFAGENAETADKVKLAEAQKMESEGKAADEIYKATGWFKGLDNKWRFEIKDDLNSIDLGALGVSQSIPLGRIYYNPDLFDAYPWMRLVQIQATTDINDNYYGETTYDDDGNVIIRLNKNKFDEGERETKLTLVHEIAHVIQDVEGFATGGTAKYAREALEEAGRSGEIENISDSEIYERLGGEEEAREVERRADIEKDLADKSKEADAAKKQNDKKKYFMARLEKEGLLRKSEAMPRPHSDNAIIIFEGQELPYSTKQDEIFADAEEQNTKQAKSRSKESGFFDAAKSLFQSAWHGSRALFDYFDLGYLGTGEGAQVHGYGVYVGQNKAIVEKRYKERLSKGELSLDGKPLPDLAFDRDEFSKLPYSVQDAALRVFALGSVEEATEALERQAEVIREHPWDFPKEKKAQLFDTLNLLKSGRLSFNNGYLYEVEIPDNDVLLDEQKTFEEQPEKVQEALRKIGESTETTEHEIVVTLDGVKYEFGFGNNYGWHKIGSIMPVPAEIQEKLNAIPHEEYQSETITTTKNEFEGFTGKQIYKKISDWNGGDRAASELLNQYGVEGITYDGRTDGRCFVIFNDKAISIINTYNQMLNGQGEIKGEYNPYDNVVTMFKGADASTVIHETWHFFVEQMWNMVQSGNASEQTVKDFETLLSYAGMTMDEWAAADLDGRRKAHEKLAEAGETYIMEGKSPSYELRRVFRNFAKWLKAIYATIQRSENYAELTDDVREVFDRMLAAEDDIAHMERVNGYFSKLPDVITDNMSDETRAKVEDYIEKAREKAVDILTRRSLVNYTKERRKEIKKFKDEIRPMVEDEVSKRPVYACGYDKKDAARFRELRNQQESVGIWTDENFIDRAFPADTNPVENEIAHWAAVLNPKNWTKGLGEVKKEYQRQADEILQPAIDVLESGMGQGVETLRETNMFGEAKGDIVGRVSNNARWYQEFYAEHKRRPTKTELREMARQLISGDVNAPQVDGWMPTTAEEAEAMQAEGERLADIERHIAACDEIKEKLAEVKENYSETSAAGSEEFLFQAELTAERYGYSSADEMMQDIEKSPTKAEAVKQRINERVQELTMQDERNNYEAMIRESLYNEDEALLIGVEQQLIEEYAARAKERQEANERKAEERAEQRKVNAEVAAARKQQAKNAAQADLAKMNVKEATRTSKFITAERNAAMKSAKLLAQKKFNEALTQKNLQAYWHAMVSESMKIARRQKQNEKFLKRQVGLKREAWLNETHFAAISQLFVRMGIAKPIHMEAAAQSQFENFGAYAAAMETQFDCVDIAPWILEGSIPISDTNALTLEQNEDVVNAVKNIKAIVKAEKGVNTFNKQETWANTKSLMMQKLSALKTIWTPNPNKPTKATAMERFTASMETLDSFLEYLDDATYGWFSQTWGNIIKRASDKEYEHREAYDKADAEALKKWLPDKAAERAANEEVYYDELGNSVTKHTLVKMLINLGNKENYQRICETPPVGFERSSLWIMPDEFTNRQTAAEQTRRNLIDFLGRVLTKEDVEYAQRKIDAAEMFWGEKNELEKRVKGFGLKKVEATPVELAINGESVVLRGGYFPLMRNGETGSHAASAEVQDDDPLQGRRIRTYHTNTSATKARTQARYPVNLFPGAETQWIYESIHDLCWRETMNDFRRVLNDQELFAMLKSKIGTARMQVFKEMLEVCADPRNSKSFSEGERMLGAAAAWLRQRTSHAAIMLNFKVIAQNYANALLYGNAIDGYTMADNLRALGTYFLKYHTPGSHKEMVDFALSKSVFLRERCELPDITVRDIVNEKKEFAWEKAAREIGIKAMAMTDNATAIPNWLTAYNKKLNEGATEQEAIDYADALVRRVLGSSRITDVASIQRGGEIMKLMTMFQSFFNARYNEFLRMERLASKQWTEGQKQEAFANVASYVVSKWLGQTMLAMALALQNPFDVDDEDKWPELIKELKSYSFSMLGPIGQIGNAIAGSIAGMHEYTYRMSAVESTIENVNRSIKRIHSDKATTQDKVEGIVNTSTLFVGVPAQLNRIFWNGVDILFNGMDPEIGDIMRRRPKKERK